MKILGIETSCDETAASVLEIKNGKVKILSNIISSQIKIHQKYGGVVPELAARKHTENIIHVIDKAIISSQKSKVKSQKLVDVIAVTNGPGLITSLMVGVETSKTLAWSWRTPLITINHLEAHIYSSFISTKKESLLDIKFPSLCLLVSGGHTELILIKNHGKYKIVGETLDDAAGEAFDKIAKMIGVEYPGGPNVAKLAEKGKKEVFKLPRPMIGSDNFDFSLSGLKSAVHRIINDHKKLSIKNKRDICAEFQQSVIDVLIHKTIKAAEFYKVKNIMIAGGVSANKELRKQLGKKIKTTLPKVNFISPDLKFCTDNAAMVAVAGYFKYNKNSKPYNLEKININPNLSL